MLKHLDSDFSLIDSIRFINVYLLFGAILFAGLLAFPDKFWKEVADILFTVPKSSEAPVLLNSDSKRCCPRQLRFSWNQ